MLMITVLFLCIFGGINMNIIDKNEYQTILNLYNEGCPRSVIAKKYDVSRSQINTILKILRKN